MKGIVILDPWTVANVLGIGKASTSPNKAWKAWKRLVTLGTLGILLAMSLSAATYQAGRVLCDDGRNLAASPFASPERMCGELPPPAPKPATDPDYIAVYGEKPTRANTGLSGRELRRARFTWTWTLKKWGGLVSTMDALDPENATNAENVKQAVEFGQLDLELFNDDRIAQVSAWFVEYGIGLPIFTLEERVTWNQDHTTNKGMHLVVKTTTMPPTFGMNLDTALRYPQLGIAAAQVKMTQAGQCVTKRIEILRMPGLEVCTN